MLIYKITNIINGKVYIGQTSRTIKRRWTQHPDKCCQKLYNAIIKYGKSNFKIEEIDSAQTQEELNQKEIHWISFYNSMFEGYNIQAGGYKGKHSAETRKKISEGLSGSNNGMYGKKPSKETLEKRSKALLGKKRSEFQRKRASICSSQRLSIYCHQTNEVYHSISEAARRLNIGNSHICRVLKGNRTHTGGYTFEYADKSLNKAPKKNLSKEERSIIMRNRDFHGKRQIKCIESGKVYMSISEASRELNICNSSFSYALKGKGKTAHGLHFIYLD